MTSKTLSPAQRADLLQVLQARFEKNMSRHPSLTWGAVQIRLESKTDKLWSLQEMEITGGEPDVVHYDEQTGAYVFYDCAAESPKGRRSLCYDAEALETRKDFKPENTVLDMAAEMGIELLDEAQYHTLQQTGKFDLKTSSWLKTPAEVRKLGGAIFGDRRYNRVFIYHNGASSYYAARGFRGLLKV